MYKVISYIIALLFAPLAVAQQVLTVEAPSPDPTLIVRGPEKSIALINAAGWEKQDDFLALFSTAYGKSVTSERTIYTALQIDKEMKVVAIVNGGTGKGVRPSFQEALKLTVPEGGFVLVASDNDYASKGWKKFVAENFRVGDVVKLRVNGEIHSLEQVLAVCKGVELPGIELEEDYIRTVVGTRAVVKGRILNYNRKAGYTLKAVQGETTQTISVNGKGMFTAKLALQGGSNYFDLVLDKDGKELENQPLVIYSKNNDATESRRVMWVEQFPNAKVLTNREAVTKMVGNIVEAGFNTIGLDVKGPEGYASYRKNDLSGTPYFTATKNPNKKVADNGLDLLQVVLEEAHKAGLEVFVSFNFFTEGNYTTQDYAVLEQHKDWEEIVQRPEDKGRLLNMSQSTRGKDAAAGKLIALAFVNPSNREVQDFQLLRVEEVLKNYDVDGIVLDRCRYDNLYADFSHVTRNAFEEYLTAQGKTLENFPADAFRIDKNGALVKGQYYKEWITFRSQTIADFVGRVRELVDTYKTQKNPDLKMAAYVGSWYEVYYQNGVNWASGAFDYHTALNFPESEIYGEAYSATSYLKYLDFLMIGTYYKTVKEINRYITLGNILTNGELPILGSISLPDLAVSNPENVYAASLKNSAGLMIFDYCYVDWEAFVRQMKLAYAALKTK
ncbi:MAG: family 10 glycosylhydrolase [Bacteroides sp.]|nr:family 10 glycosylhydrolase [Bacteroides sp.]